MAEQRRFGKRIVATVTNLKGHCGAGHFVGQTFEVGLHETGGMCGVFYHDLYPWVMMMAFGGATGWGDPNVIRRGCIDRVNEVEIELKRMED